MTGFKLAVSSLAVVAAVAAAACADAPEPAGSSAPATSAPPPPPAAAREFGAPAQMTIPDEGTVTVRFVTYGDVDPDDEIPFGVVPNVQIAVIWEREPIDARDSIRHLDDWWMTVGGNDKGIEL